MNFDVDIVQVKDGEVCATYVCIHPSLTKTLQDYCYNLTKTLQDYCYNNMKHPEDAFTTPRLSRAYVASLKTILTFTKVEDVDSKVFTLRQKAGEVVDLPPGWLYQYTAHSRAVVISQTYITSLESLPAVAGAYTQLACKYSCCGDAFDSMAIQKLAINFAMGHPWALSCSQASQQKVMNFLQSMSGSILRCSIHLRCTFACARNARNSYISVAMPGSKRWPRGVPWQSSWLSFN